MRRFTGVSVLTFKATLTAAFPVAKGSTPVPLLGNIARYATGNNEKPPEEIPLSGEEVAAPPTGETAAPSDSSAVEPLGERELYDPPPFTTALTRIHWLPLPLIEEIPLPERILTEIELIMSAWSEEQAKYFFVMTWVIRVMIFVGWSFLLWYFYRVCIITERRLRGTANMPSGLKLGNVVYFDIESNGSFLGRVVVGLMSDDCPLYCEYFHRRCTGSGGNGESFRGLKCLAMISSHAACFGEGSDMEHDVPGFNPRWLPTEKESEGAWRGAVSALGYDRQKQSPNFMFHVSAGDYTPQIFAMVLSGWETIDKINRGGSKQGGAPKNDYVIGGCGELCTLDKSHITPLPWRLYETVTNGYDTEKYGETPDGKFLIPPSMRAKNIFERPGFYPSNPSGGEDFFPLRKKKEVTILDQ